MLLAPSSRSILITFMVLYTSSSKQDICCKIDYEITQISKENKKIRKYSKWYVLPVLRPILRVSLLPGMKWKLSLPISSTNKRLMSAISSTCLSPIRRGRPDRKGNERELVKRKLEHNVTWQGDNLGNP